MTDTEKQYAWSHRPNGKEHALEFWRLEHEGQPDPDDATLNQWFVDNERESMLEWWNDLNPGEPVPDDVKLRDWYIGQRSMGIRNLLLAHKVIKLQ